LMRWLLGVVAAGREVEPSDGCGATGSRADRNPRAALVLSRHGRFTGVASPL
jgi:hypothetical protein